METTRVTAIWEGPDRDILTILVDPWPSSYEAELSNLDTRLALFHLSEDDDNGDEVSTGEVVGIEIDDFLDFDHWSAIPILPRTWQLPDLEPRQLVGLLKWLQTDLQARFRTPVLA